MTVLGIISNRYSDGNGGHSAIAGYAAAQPGMVFAAPDDLADLPGVIRDFARRGVGVIAVDGGDGTIRDVLSVLSEGYGADWPAIAVLPSGKTNLIARDVGTFGGGLSGLRRLVDAAERHLAGAVWTERHCLEVVWRDDPGRVLRGLFFGAGIFTYATRMAGQWSHRRGIKQSPAVAVVIARVLWQTLRGRRGGTLMAVSPDSAAETAESKRFLVLATTLQHLVLGLWPFPPGGGPLHWLDVQAPPRRLIHALWTAWRGRLAARPEFGYHGGGARELSIRLRAPFVVDGELYDPGADGIVLRAGPPIRFVSG